MPDSGNTAHDNMYQHRQRQRVFQDNQCVCVCDQGLVWQLEGGLQNGPGPLPGGPGTHWKVAYDTVIGDNKLPPPGAHAQSLSLLLPSVPEP